MNNREGESKNERERERTLKQRAKFVEIGITKGRKRIGLFYTLSQDIDVAFVLQYLNEVIAVRN